MNKYKPWGKQKELQKKDIPTALDIQNIINSIEDVRVKVLVILEYLTAGRVSELVGRKEYYKYSKEKIEGLKIIDIVVNKEGLESYKYRYKVIENGITKRNIAFIDMKGREVMLIRLYNRKHKNKHKKEIPIPIDKEMALVNIVKDYLETLDYNQPLFEFGRIQAYNLIMKATDFNNHFFRHIRATHLVVYHDYNEYKLVRFMGWTDSRPAKAYMELRTHDLLY